MISDTETQAMKLCIVRTKPTTDETAPWQGISFTCLVGSDALADRLKHAYPECKTLRERKHTAAIDFLVSELKEMQSKKEEQTPPPEFQDNPSFGSPRNEFKDLPDRISAGTTSPCTSPTTPHSVQSQQLADRSRLQIEQYTVPKTQHSPQPATTPTTQTFVFSAIDGRTLQPKTKRKMTSEERVLYKETRKRGACHKCKRMKGKCTHGDNADMSEWKPAAKRRGSSVRVQDPQGSSKIRKTEELLDAPHASTETQRNGIRNTESQPTYHERPTTLNDSLGTGSLSRESDQWGTPIGGEGQSYQILSPSIASSQSNGSSSSHSPTPTNTAPTTTANTPES